jgi:hypothetical protein
MGITQGNAENLDINPLATVLILILYTPGTVLISTKSKNQFFFNMSVFI